MSTNGLWSDDEINELHLAAGYEEEVAEAKHRSLIEDYGAPPFTVLDARQGYWRERKRQWLALSIKDSNGRLADLVSGSSSPRPQWERGYEGGEPAWGGSGTSIFDPVLAELICAWFCPPAGGILDPFAGGSTRGIVAAKLGLEYTGIELRAEQVEANKQQARDVGVSPLWLCGDSAQLPSCLVDVRTDKIAMYDMIFTCPPYYNLEKYEGGEEDGSARQSYTEFLGWYRGVFELAVARLRPNRFLVVVVGEVRDEAGSYYNFVFDNTRILQGCGLHYYNEAVFITPIGSLPIRTARQFPASRKLGKGHQNILVFYKGDPRDISKHFPREVKLADLGDGNA